MGHPYKAKAIHFCPFCGGSLITSLGDDSLLCGTGDADIDIANRPNCSRTFRVLKSPRSGPTGKSARRAFNTVAQEQYEEHGIRLPGRGQ